MASSARASGSYFGSPENFGQPVLRRVGLVGLQPLRQRLFGAGRGPVAAHLGEEGERDDVTAVEVLAVVDHGHQRLARVAHHSEEGTPHRGGIGLLGEHLR